MAGQQMKGYREKRTEVMIMAGLLGNSARNGPDLSQAARRNRVKELRLGDEVTAWNPERTHVRRPRA
jgi:hypothetical protein